MRLNAVIQWMVDGADQKISFKFLEGLFDCCELDIIIPQQSRACFPEIGSKQIASFTPPSHDLSAFTGDVMTWVRERIKTSSFVLAELTGANPNVYLEVGFAWGCGIPTILLVKDSEKLKFDTRG